MTLLKIKNLSKSFTNENKEKLQVLENINLNINKHEFITLIGPSGCGKSTLLNMIAALIQPDTGQILLNNKTINSPDKDRVMVFQEAALFPWLSVIGNVMFGLRANKIDKKTAYKQALKQLKAVHLHKFKDAYPYQLSGGMKQRVAIARSLVMDPEILLMDEPFGALDEQTRIILQKELMEIWVKTKKTIIFVTHNIREAVKLSDRIVILGSNPGTILEDLRIDFPRPRSRQNAKLIKIENNILNILQKEISRNIQTEEGELKNEAIHA